MVAQLLVLLQLNMRTEASLAWLSCSSVRRHCTYRCQEFDLVIVLFLYLTLSLLILLSPHYNLRLESYESWSARSCRELGLNAIELDRAKQRGPRNRLPLAHFLPIILGLGDDSEDTGSSFSF